ncbi:hypothetical protein Vadar_022336 [Vaccinium darrowii]|uniref:Uncharacterized protein n=1 Tax=Vaccinium darrowii TaxID=229202 RepID=A0ACB7Y855_9ERIC|nr:hypothetical protein Vadar_022336 [Vaccinium darrowii]
MLNAEDLQLSQDFTSEHDVTSVLVATHGNSSGQKVINPTEEQVSFVKMNVPMLSQFDVSAQSGKGFRGGRFPREPCGICGRTNHITNYCYYRNQVPQVDQTSIQWKSGVAQSYSWVYAGQNGVLVPPQFQVSGNMNGFSMPQPSHIAQSYQNSGPIIQKVPSAICGGYVSGNTVGNNQGMHQPQSQFVAPQAHFTGAYNMHYMTPSISRVSNASQMATHTGVSNGMSQQPAAGQSSVGSVGGVSQQPWIGVMKAFRSRRKASADGGYDVSNTANEWAVVMATFLSRFRYSLLRPTMN